MSRFCLLRDQLILRLIGWRLMRKMLPCLAHEKSILLPSYLLDQLAKDFETFSVG